MAVFRLIGLESGVRETAKFGISGTWANVFSGKLDHTRCSSQPKGMPCYERRVALQPFATRSRFSAFNAPAIMRSALMNASLAQPSPLSTATESPPAFLVNCSINRSFVPVAECHHMRWVQSLDILQLRNVVRAADG